MRSIETHFLSYKPNVSVYERAPIGALFLFYRLSLRGQYAWSAFVRGSSTMLVTSFGNARRVRIPRVTPFAVLL